MKFTECLNPLSVGAIDHYTYLQFGKKKISKGFSYSKLTMNTRIQRIGITLKNLMGKYTEQRNKNESKKKESKITLIFTSTRVGLIIHEKCPNTDFFRILIFRIWTEYRDLKNKPSYLGRIRENTNQ